MERQASAGAARHALLLYRTAEEFTGEVLGFVAEGVAGGEPVLVVAAGPNLRSLRAQLGGQGEVVTWADLSDGAGRGANPGRVTALVRGFAAGHAGQPVRCVQEPVWPLQSRLHLREAVRYEALLNLVLAGRRAAVLCAYDQRVGAEVLASAQRAHSHLLDGGRWKPNAAFAAGQMTAPGAEDSLLPPPSWAPTLTYRRDQARVRRFVADYAARTPLPPDRIPDLILAVGELAGNTLAHTSGPGTVTIWHDGSEVVCQVHDTGHITDLLAGTLRPDPGDAGRGRGLWVVHQVCDLAEIRSGPAGTTVRLHLRYR